MSGAAKNPLEPKELKHRLQGPPAGRPIIVDIRDPQEYEEWRIEGSLNIPLRQLKSGEGLSRLPRGSDVVTVCAYGIRSADAADYLRKQGVPARSLAEGLVGWSKVYDAAPVPLDGTEGLRLLQIRRLGKGCTSYIIGYQGVCAVIDPSVHTDEFLALAKLEGLRILHVLDTHQHADHVSGARALARASSARLYLNPLDAYRYTDFIPLREEDTIALGDGGVTIEAVHTPGHTKGSTSFLIHGQGILTGDTLFVEGIARPDLRDRAEEYAVELYNTYREKLPLLPPGVTVLPGHFSRSVRLELGKPFGDTLQEIRRRMPILESSRGEFTQYVLHRIPPKPPNYEAIVRINRGDDPYNPSDFDMIEAGPNRCAVPT